MSIVGLLVLLIVVGAGLYLLNLAPIDPTMRQIIRVVVIVVLIIAVILFLAGLIGLQTGMAPVRLR